jgi:hypothetical protein
LEEEVDGRALFHGGHLRGDVGEDAALVGISKRWRTVSIMRRRRVVTETLSGGLMPMTASPEPSSRPSRMEAAMPGVVGGVVGLEARAEAAGQADGGAEAGDDADFGGGER